MTGPLSMTKTDHSCRLFAAFNSRRAIRFGWLWDELRFLACLWSIVPFDVTLAQCVMLINLVIKRYYYSLIQLFRRTINVLISYWMTDCFSCTLISFLIAFCLSTFVHPVSVNRTISWNTLIVKIQTNQTNKNPMQLTPNCRALQFVAAVGCWWII